MSVTSITLTVCLSKKTLGIESGNKKAEFSLYIQGQGS